MSIQVVNPLEKFYQYEQEKANKTFLRQAYNGQWHSTTWKKAGEEIRKMAAALKALNLPPQMKTNGEKNENYPIICNIYAC